MRDNTPDILIIDNDDGLTAALSCRLENLGYRCSVAGSGAQGISAFKDRPIDLVITDLNMPAGDGVTLIRTIRGVSPVPIIVVTGFRAEYLGELDGFEGVSILEKPFETEHLLDLVETDLALSGAE